MPGKLTILAAVLVAMLAWAYVVSHPGEGAASGRGNTVLVWDVQPREVTRIVFRDGEERVVIEPRWKGNEETPYLWVTTQNRTARKKSRPAVKNRTKAARKTAKKDRTEKPQLARKAFKGNRAAEGLFGQLVSLRSPRAIGLLENLKAKDFGFPAVRRAIEIQTRGREPLILEVGADTYGKNLFYGHSKTDGKVYLVRKNVLSRLQKARTSLVDRRLFLLPPAKAERIVIAMAGKSKTLWRLRGGEPGWGAEAGEAGADPAMLSFVERLGKIRVGEFESREEKAQMGVTALDLVVYQAAGGGATEKLQVFSGQGTTLQARSSHTRTSVRISRHQLQPLLNGGEKILKAP